MVQLHTLSEHVSFTFHFHCLKRAGIRNDLKKKKKNDWLSAIKVRQVNLTGQSLNDGTAKWQHITWNKRRHFGRQPWSFNEKVWEKHSQWFYRKHKSCPGKICLMVFFFFFSIFSASSASRKTQLTWAPSFMWLSYSFCHKSGCKSSLALSRGLVFVRSRTNHGVKHNSGVVVKLFTFPLIHFCDLWRDLRQNRKTMRCLSCSPHRWSRCRSDDEGQSPVKLYNLMSF